ncbi:vacuolar fusion protein MON1 homolog B-like isoform X5 [Dendrobates tinctorius]
MDVSDAKHSENSLDDSTRGTAEDTERVSMGLMEVPETSDVGGHDAATVNEVGGLDIRDCLQQGCMSAAEDVEGETGGMVYDDSQPPQDLQTIGEELSCMESAEGNDTGQTHRKNLKYNNTEASADETKLSDLVAANPGQSISAGDHDDEHKELTDNVSEDSGDFPGVSSGVTSDASPPATPVQREEDVTAESWRTKRKHVFVLSEAGKPIYSRYGNEEALSSTMGVMMALVSFVQSGNNSIRSIHSDKQKVVFLQQGPLVLVSVSRAPQSEEQLRKELQYVYYQIISMLTQASVARIFERKKNYDLRRLLTGSEKILDSLLDLLDTDPGFLLGAVRCVTLPSPLRDSLSSILTKAITPNLVFSILVAEQQLVTVVQERAVIEDCRLDPADLQLLLNLIGASSAFQAGEIWTPICLPRFNPDGYFYAYISYLDPDCTVCLVLLSTDKESFYAVSGCKRKIQEAMGAQNSLQALAGALCCCSYSASLVGVPELLHFVYKPLDIPENYQQLPQFTSPEPDGPYTSEEERQRLFDLYRYLHCRIHSSARPLRLIYHVAEKETLLAWVTSKFELYMAFSSLVTKVGAINVITKLLRWIKREEDRLFIRYPPKYSTTPVPGKGVKSSRTDRTDPSQNGFFTGL